MQKKSCQHAVRRGKAVVASLRGGQQQAFRFKMLGRLATPGRRTLEAAGRS